MLAWICGAALANSWRFHLHCCEPFRCSFNIPQPLVQCTPGYIAGGYALSGCTICPAVRLFSLASWAYIRLNQGTYAPSTQGSVCQLCDSGTFNPVSGASACLECSLGWTSGPGSFICTPCSAVCLCCCAAVLLTD